jgi:tRNA-2-methylthio-N6-dimethylallyladenosine synthase
MPFFHLPIQSGSEDVLFRMNRKMAIKDYYEIIDFIREKLPESAISTDLIVGFPNETDEEFEKTIELYERVQYDNAYTFIYSKRVGTPAATLEDTTPISTKEERLHRLENVVRKYSKICNEK